MAWYRIGQTNYAAETAARVFHAEPEERRPVVVSLETGELVEIGQVDAVNVVYYRDLDSGEECGDFFFSSVEDAIHWCDEALKIDPHQLQFFEPFLTLKP